jgi:hypothetical protein
MSAFGEAFKAARKAGKKNFTFGGKSYNTRTKDDEAKMSSSPTKKVSASLTKKTPIGPSKGDLKPATVTAKKKTVTKPKPKATTAGGRASERLAAGTLPGRKVVGTTQKKAAPKKYGRQKNTVILNSPRAR